MDNFENVTPVIEEDKTIFTETKDIEDEVNTVYVSKEDDDKKEDEDDKDEKSTSDDVKDEDDKDQYDDKKDAKKYELL